MRAISVIEVFNIFCNNLARKAQERGLTAKKLKSFLEEDCQVVEEFLEEREDYLIALSRLSKKEYSLEISRKETRVG